MRFEIPEQKQLVHTLTLPIRWGDMDVMGHVNNTIYFRYMEIIRLEWLRETGVPANPEGLGPVIVNAFCNFYRQFEYPDEVLLKMYVSDPGRTTFESWATMEKVAEPGVVCAAGGATTIWVNFPQQKAVGLPDWIRAIVSD